MSFALLLTRPESELKAAVNALVGVRLRQTVDAVSQCTNAY